MFYIPLHYMTRVFTRISVLISLLTIQALTGSGPGGRIIASDLTHATSAPAAAATAASYTDIDLSSMRKVNLHTFNSLPLLVLRMMF